MVVVGADHHGRIAQRRIAAADHRDDIAQRHPPLERVAPDGGDLRAASGAPGGREFRGEVRVIHCYDRKLFFGRLFGVHQPRSPQPAEEKGVPFGEQKRRRRILGQRAPQSDIPAEERAARLVRRDHGDGHRAGGLSWIQALAELHDDAAADLVPPRLVGDDPDPRGGGPDHPRRALQGDLDVHRLFADDPRGRLEVADIARGLEPGGAEAGGDVFSGDLEPLRRGVAPFESVGGEE